MKFIHLTDTHVRKAYSGDGIDAVLGRLPNPATNIKNLFERLDWTGVDFVAVTGDLVHEGTTEDYQYLKKQMEELVPAEIKIFYVLGNHDYKEEFYRGMFGQEKKEAYYYTSIVDGYRLIILDSAVPGKESGTITTEQLEWLRQTLVVPSEKGSIVFLHHPVFWITGGMTMELTNGAEVLEILKDSDVLAVFCGHTHTNAIQEKDGIRQYTADSMAFSIEANRERLSFTDKSGYLTAEINEKGILVHSETTREGIPAVTFPAEVFAEQLAKLDE